MSAHFTVYTQQEYFNDLIEKVERTKKGDRVAISTMGLEVHDHNTSALLDSMGAAAARGVTTNLLVDAFARLFDTHYHPTGLLPDALRGPKISAHFAKKVQVLSSLTEQGVHIVETNSPHPINIPYAGRSHIKGAVVNDDWRIGGCNLADTDNLDTMIGNRHKPTADFLYSLFKKIAKAGNVREALGDKDVVWPIDESTDLLIDAGVPGQSVIYERVLGAIDNAEDWITLTCQFFPSGKTARELAKAIHRDVDGYVFFNNGIHNRLGSGVMNVMQSLSKLRFPRELFRGELEKDRPFLHAKILATEKEAILGSHNLIDAGVKLGTAEVALHSKDPQTVRQIALMAHKLASKDDDPEFLFVNT